LALSLFKKFRAYLSSLYSVSARFN
jgi:hypothetical protein